jgi:hypothetical protein
VLKWGFGLVTISVMFLCTMLYSDNFNLLMIAFSALGFFILPMMPTVMENCAECTYPVDEEISVGILLVGGNITGIPLIFLLQYLITLPPVDGCFFLQPANICLVGKSRTHTDLHTIKRIYYV